MWKSNVQNVFTIVQISPEKERNVVYIWPQLHMCFLTDPILMLLHKLQGLQLYILLVFSFLPIYKPRMLLYKKQCCNKFACFSFSFQIIIVIAGHIDRMQDVTTAALRLHLLVDHQPCQIKRECQGRWAHTTQSWGWALSCRRDSSSLGLHYDDSSVLNAHHVSLLWKAFCCAAEYVSYSTWKIRRGSHPFELEGHNTGIFDWCTVWQLKNMNQILNVMQLLINDHWKRNLSIFCIVTNQDKSSISASRKAMIRFILFMLCRPKKMICKNVFHTQNNIGLNWVKECYYTNTHWATFSHLWIKLYMWNWFRTYVNYCQFARRLR